ncbi:ARM repeat-containing protein, partial [Rhizopogon salebrosus TDB-379]
TSATPNLPAQLPPSIPTRFIQNLSEVEYPEGIKGPKAGLNANVTNGRFRYDRDFLMQFMHICKEKPLALSPLDVPGITPIDPSSFAMVRDGHGRHRNPSTAMATTANRQASMGIFQSTGSKLTSEEHFALSSAWSYAIGNGNGNRSNRTRSKRGAKHGGSDKATLSKQGQGSAFESSCIVPPGTDLEPVVPIEMFANNLTTPSMTREGQLEVDSPEMAEREIKALLDKLTMDEFDSISDQIIEWANRSVDEKDGRTLIEVIRLVFEKAADEAACSEMYARLCRKMMEQINPDVQDGEIKDQQGEPISGGQLFRRHLIERCREDFERVWSCKEPTNAGNEKKGMGEAGVYSYESDAAQIAKRRCLGLVKFIGEMFMLQMLSGRIMHQFVRKLLADIQKEAQIETLCQLF